MTLGGLCGVDTGAAASDLGGLCAVDTGGAVTDTGRFVCCRCGRF